MVQYLFAWKALRYCIRGVFAVGIAAIFLPLFSLLVRAQDSSASQSSMPYFIAPPPPPVVMPPTGNAYYLLIRLGAGSTIVQDAALSPLRYLGLAALGGVEYRAYENNIFLSIGSDVQVGSLAPSIGNDLNAAQILSIYTLPTTALGFRIVQDEEQHLRAFVGGMLQGIAHIKVNSGFGNSALASDSYTGLGAFARVEKDFSLLGKAFRASSQFQLPIVGFATRPSYSTPTRYPASGSSNPLSVFSELRGVVLTSFPILSFRNSLEYMLPSGNFIALNYDWDFYSYNHFNKVQVGRHGISLALMFKF